MWTCSIPVPTLRTVGRQAVCSEKALANLIYIYIYGLYFLGGHTHSVFFFMSRCNAQLPAPLEHPHTTLSSTQPPGGSMVRRPDAPWLSAQSRRRGRSLRLLPAHMFGPQAALVECVRLTKGSAVRGSFGQHMT